MPQMTANFRAKSVTNRHQELWALALTDTLEHFGSGLNLTAPLVAEACCFVTA